MSEKNSTGRTKEDRQRKRFFQNWWNTKTPLAKAAAGFLLTTVLGSVITYLFPGIWPGPQVKAAVYKQSFGDACEQYHVEILSDDTLDYVYFTVQFPDHIQDHAVASYKYSLPGAVEMANIFIVGVKDGRCILQGNRGSLPVNVRESIDPFGGQVQVEATNLSNPLEGTFLLPHWGGKGFPGNLVAEGYYQYSVLGRAVTRQLHFQKRIVAPGRPDR